MQPGRELDALIAEKVLGLETEGGLVVVGAGAFRAPSHALPIPYYSTSITAAWEVVEKLAAHRPSKFNIEKCGTWLVRFDAGTFTPGLTAPFAICLAALKAAGYIS